MKPSCPDRVVIISDFSTVRGGASQLAVSQAALLSARGVLVTFFSGDATHDLPKGVSQVAVGGQRLLEGGRVSAALAGLWNRASSTLLADWIAQNDTAATIYHLHGYHQTLSPSVLAPLRRVRSRSVMHAHDYFLACPNGAFFDFRSGQTCERAPLSSACVMRNCDKRNYGHKLWRVARQTVQNTARRQLAPEVTTILLHDAMQARLFARRSPGGIRVIPNPAQAFLASPVAAERNSDLIYVGDIHSYKGVRLLACAGRQAGVQIRFVGDGQDKEALARDYPEHRFDGWQDRAGLCRIMADARILVAPTLGPEPYGLAPAEALMSGIPVLISDSMLLAGDIDTGGMGLRFAAGDRDDLARALVTLAHDDGLVARLSRSARSHARDLSLSDETWCDALLGLYGDILDRPAAR